VTRKPDPLPDQTAALVLPDGRIHPDWYRWFRDADRAVKATIDFIDTPVPDPEFVQPDQYPLLIAFPANRDYVLIQNNDVERTIIQTVTDADSGSCTVTFKINSTALGGSAHSASSTESVISRTSANVLGVGDDLIATVSGNSNCRMLRLNAKTTRTIVAG